MARAAMKIYITTEQWRLDDQTQIVYIISWGIDNVLLWVTGDGQFSAHQHTTPLDATWKQIWP